MTCCGNEKFTLKCEKKNNIYICDVQVKTCAKWTMEGVYRCVIVILIASTLVIKMLHDTPYV